MCVRSVLWAALVTCVAAAPVAAQELGIGDPAPKFVVKEFVKGDPFDDFAKGKIYVVEFWATWCGPCIQSIPHVSKLQATHKDVTVVGVSVSERDPSGVKPFVEKMGDKMAYRVAIDTPEGTMSKTWLSAARQSGIPAAFIVNGDGIVAWIGHPMQMDKPLADIVAGKFDVQAAAAEFKENAAMQQKLTALQAKLTKAQQSANLGEVVKVLDEAIAQDPKLEKRLATFKFRALQQAGDVEKAVSYGQHLVEKIFKDDKDQLNAIAWGIVDPNKQGQKSGPQFQQLALLAAQRANAIAEGKDGAILDTLACAYFAVGEKAKALETQEKAIEYAKGTAFENDAEMKARLEQYRKAVQNK